MNWDQIKGNWTQFKGHVRETWGDLTDDDVARIEGNQEPVSYTHLTLPTTPYV